MNCKYFIGLFGILIHGIVYSQPSGFPIGDVSGMFNERGFIKSNSYSYEENEIINDFNGNLLWFVNQNFIPSNSYAISKRYYHKNKFFLTKIEEPKDTNVDKNPLINCQNNFELYKKAYELIKDTDIVIKYFNDYMINRDSLNICVSPRIYDRIQSLFFINEIIETEFNELSDSCKYLKKRELILEEYNNSNETEKYKICEKVKNINTTRYNCDLILFFEIIHDIKFRADLFIYFGNESDDYFSSDKQSPILMTFLFYYDNDNIRKVIIKNFVQ